MRINDDYKIISVDKLNVQIQKRTIVEDKESENYGKENWITQAYCSSLESALMTLVKWEINGTGLVDLKTVLDKIEELKSIIERFSEMVSEENKMILECCED